MGAAHATARRKAVGLDAFVSSISSAVGTLPSYRQQRNRRTRSISRYNSAARQVGQSWSANCRQRQLGGAPAHRRTGRRAYRRAYFTPMRNQATSPQRSYFRRSHLSVLRWHKKVHMVTVQFQSQQQPGAPTSVIASMPASNHRSFSPNFTPQCTAEMVSLRSDARPKVESPAKSA